MFRKLLGSVLVLSWIILSGLDVWEDLHPLSQIELRGSAESPFSALPQTGRLVNNIIETAPHWRLRPSALLELPVVQLSVQLSVSSQRSSKLHKFHQVF